MKISKQFYYELMARNLELERKVIELESKNKSPFLLYPEEPIRKNPFLEMIMKKKNKSSEV